MYMSPLIVQENLCASQRDSYEENTYIIDVKIIYIQDLQAVHSILRLYSGINLIKILKEHS